MPSSAGLAKGLLSFPNKFSTHLRSTGSGQALDSQITGPVAPALDREVLGLHQIEVSYEPLDAIVWAYMRPEGRPCQNPGMLSDFKQLQDGVERSYTQNKLDIKYFVFGSHFPGVFSLGGDLNLFVDRIRKGDEIGLINYGKECVEVLYRNMNALSLPIITIGLVQGDALGGGFEGLLSFDVIVAEKGTKFGFPEILFGLFPGMGAYSFLARRLGTIKAQEMILEGRMYSAEEMHALGIVHILVEQGQGKAAVRAYISRNSRRRNGQQAIYQAARAVNRISLEELEEIVTVWAAAAMNLNERDLSIMERLVRAQDRLKEKSYTFAPETKYA